MGLGYLTRPLVRPPAVEAWVKGLVSFGALLVVIWVAAFIVFKVAGFFIHLVLIVGVILLILGMIRRVGGRTTT